MSSKNNPKSNKPRPWLMVAAATAAVLLVLGGMFMLLRNTPPAAEAPAAGSAPKAVVEQIELDAGYQIFSTPVQHVFKISNTGQGPLTILGEPKVELIEGCWPPRAVVGSTTIQPGESTEVSMGYTMTEGMGGPHQFNVIVRTNDPANPELVLVSKSDWGP